MRKVMMICAAVMSVAAAAGTASATAYWPTIRTAGSVSSSVTDTHAGHSVTGYGTIASDASSASTIRQANSGSYSTYVAVGCANGNTNSNSAANSNVSVACPFFASTVTSANGSVTSQ